MILGGGVLPYVGSSAVQADLPFVGELDCEWHDEPTPNELGTDSVMAISRQAHKGQKCQRGCAWLLECVIAPKIELGTKGHAANAGLAKNGDRVNLVDARGAIRLPYEGELDGVREPDSEVSGCELVAIGDGTSFIGARTPITEKVRLDLNVPCVDSEWALRCIWSVCCHFSQQAVRRGIEQRILALVGTERVKRRDQQRDGRPETHSGQPPHIELLAQVDNPTTCAAARFIVTGPE